MKIKDMGDLLGSLNYKDRKFDKEVHVDGVWHSPALRMPVQFSKVEVIDYQGRQKLAKFEVDNNWNVPGFAHDAFNNNIALWRYV